ncbi:Mitochondrial fission protein [Blastocystis sp. ATCC 50177/Nand II]|uniref:Mitochondrial fission protein n=1 Tax=Blastocystis sp. subtype 1 (strain ATCC 50177 / NandII) TaxID=478820 RepID=A0A196SBS0_BLAHN|nr:Mitochondrial fission protein [Blastocystis sp. ATCC 50177/Nand II]
MFDSEGTNVYNEAEILAEIRRAKEEYLRDIENDIPSPKAAFNYACALVRSREKYELEKSVEIFETLIDDGFQTHKCIYNIAYAYYKLGKLRQSRLFCERLLKLDPLNQQAQDLHQQLDAVVQQKGLLGLGITTLLVAGAGIVLYKTLGRK